MRASLFDTTVFGDPRTAVDFIENVLESSTEYSIIGKDPEGTILSWSEGAHRLYGYEPEEVVGKHNSTILHVPEDVLAGKPRQMREAALEIGKWEGTIQNLRKDSTRFTARMVLTPLRVVNGKPIGYLLISKGIADEIRLTEQLQATHLSTRSFIELNIDPLMTIDPLGIITDVNQQMEALTGASREELIGTLFKSLFTDPGRAEEGLLLVLQEGKVTNYELAAQRKDGLTSVASFNLSTFSDRDGNLQGVFAAARDFTEQKSLEQQVRASEAFNRGLIEASLDGLITMDPLFTITHVNDTMCRMSGYAREELIGTPLPQYFTDPRRAANGVSETIDEGSATNCELTLRAKDGVECLVSFNVAIFKDSIGAVRGIFASARDITAQKELEERLREQQFYTRSLIELNIDALVTTDPLGIITDVNQQMAALTGYSREELIGTQFKTYLTDSAGARKA